MLNRPRLSKPLFRSRPETRCKYLDTGSVVHSSQLHIDQAIQSFKYCVYVCLYVSYKYINECFSYWPNSNIINSIEINEIKSVDHKNGEIWLLRDYIHPHARIVFTW